MWTWGLLRSSGLQNTFLHGNDNNVGLNIVIVVCSANLRARVRRARHPGFRSRHFSKYCWERERENIPDFVYIEVSDNCRGHEISHFKKEEKIFPIRYLNWCGLKPPPPCREQKIFWTVVMRALVKNLKWLITIRCLLTLDWNSLERRTSRGIENCESKAS